jgi:hypothetical protein
MIPGIWQRQVLGTRQQAADDCIRDCLVAAADGWHGNQYIIIFRSPAHRNRPPPHQKTLCRTYWTLLPVRHHANGKFNTAGKIAAWNRFGTKVYCVTITVIRV